MSKFHNGQKVICIATNTTHYIMHATPDVQGDVRIYYKGQTGDWTFRKESDLMAYVGSPPLPSTNLSGGPKVTCGSDHGSPAGKCVAQVTMMDAVPTVDVDLKEKKVDSPLTKPNPIILSEECNMSNSTCGSASFSATPSRRTVTFTLIDPDTSLDVADSVVLSSGVIVIEDDTQTAIQQLIVEGEVGVAIKEHNVIRAAQTDINILKNTGKEVGLLPIKLKDLQWEIK